MTCRNIAAWDGGGVKGACEARATERLDNETGFLKRVDLFSGTSTGGILALALAAGVPIAECVALCRDHASTIFAPRDLADRVAGSLDEYIRADYSQDGLRQVLTDVFGTKRLPELEHEVLVPCFDLARFRPKFLDRSDDWSCVDAALATSAAPTYLPVHLVRELDQHGSSRVTRRGAIRAMVDGGVIANNPSERALSFARTRLGAGGDVRLISFGAGQTPYRPPEELLHQVGSVLDWGFRQWLVKHPHLLLKVLMDGSVALAHYACRAQLQDRYYRVQPMLPEDVDLADAAKVPLLLAVAEAYELDEAVAWLKLNWEAP